MAVIKGAEAGKRVPFWGHLEVALVMGFWESTIFSFPHSEPTSCCCINLYIADFATLEPIVTSILLLSQHFGYCPDLLSLRFARLEPIVPAIRLLSRAIVPQICKVRAYCPSHSAIVPCYCLSDLQG